MKIVGIFAIAHSDAEADKKESRKQLMLD